MGISDKIKVTTIIIDEATILQIKTTITLPFQSSLTCNKGKETSQKACCEFRVFLSLVFHFRHCCDCLSSLVALPHKKNLDIRQFCPKN